MLRVAVVGAGIGGLAAALALQACGAQVAVYEQAAHLGEVGAGVGLASNSVRVLQTLGVTGTLSQHWASLHKFWFRNPDGSVITQETTGHTDSLVGVYRPDLIAALAQALPPGALRTGHRCVAFSQDEHSAQISFDNGATAKADIVVGADGIHSVLQRYVVEPDPPVFSGMVAYRGVMQAAELPSLLRRDAVMWTGPGKHFLTFPLRRGSLFNYVGFVPADQQMKESWSAPGDPAVLAGEFAGWDPQLGEVLSRVKTTFRWGLYDRNPLLRWTSGRLALLGDAAHAMLPHMGQGANQSIEDGMALAVLTRDVDTTGVSDALTRYQQLRHERATKIQQGSRANGLRYDSQEAASLVKPGLQDYDIEAEAEKVVAK